MKKRSTAVTKASRNISQQRLTVGLDLGDRNSWYCVLDEAGQIQLEQRVRTNAKALQEVFGVIATLRFLFAFVGHFECYGDITTVDVVPRVATHAGRRWRERL